MRAISSRGGTSEYNVCNTHEGERRLVRQEGERVSEDWANNSPVCAARALDIYPGLRGLTVFAVCRGRTRENSVYAHFVHRV